MESRARKLFLAGEEAEANFWTNFKVFRPSATKGLMEIADCLCHRRWGVGGASAQGFSTEGCGITLLCESDHIRDGRGRSAFTLSQRVLVIDCLQVRNGSLPCSGLMLMSLSLAPKHWQF